MTNTLIKAPQLHLQETEKLQESGRHLPMLHGKATDAIAGMSSRAGKVNPLTGALTVNNKEVKLLVSQFNKLTGTLGINTHKL